MTPLEAEIRTRIAADGPMKVAAYMELCTTDTRHGYYTTRDPFGARGDFVTAPEISQMFGELIGLWALSVWQIMGERPALHLFELGPGRGTLMADALRATRIMPAFTRALRVHLIEASPVLREIQQKTLSGFDVPIAWEGSEFDPPSERSIIIANEFFDALPVNQAVKVEGGWRERMVTQDGDRLVFTMGSETMWRVDEALPPGLRGAPLGSVFEWRSDTVIRRVARHAARWGAALIIDYGHVETGIGDTLQAMSRHRFADPLDRPGEIDLTAHVDFQVLRERAAIEGVRVQGPVSQGNFLRRLGIVERADRLKASATARQAAAIDAALARLTGDGPTGMGEMFKVMAMSHPRLPVLPGFEDVQAAG